MTETCFEDDQIIELAADTIPDGKCRRSINEYTVNELDIQSPMITLLFQSIKDQFSSVN